MSHFDICSKQKQIFFFHLYDTFLAFFSTLLSTRTIKVIGLIFFNELTLVHWAMLMHFNLIPIFYGLFPKLYIDSDHPAFIRLDISKLCLIK